jgi:hypothetical protein
MKKLVFMLMIFAGATANAQAWTGKGDQKINGIECLGIRNRITGTYDYGLNNLFQ